ncbi:MAG: hypothetical protein ACRDTC_01395 [Pseudonocardiaceae bacterium]
MSEDGKGEVTVPGVPGTNLVVVESCFVLTRSEALCDRPAGTDHVDEFAELGLVRIITPVEGEFFAVDRTADEVLTIGFDRVDQQKLCSEQGVQTLELISSSQLSVTIAKQ